MLVSSIENNFLYGKVLEDHKYDSPFLSIHEALMSEGMLVDNIMDDYFMVNGSTLLKGNSISSSLVSSQILGFRNIDNELKKTNNYSIYNDLDLPYIIRKRFSIKAKEAASIFFSNLSKLGPVVVSSKNFLDLNAGKNITSITDFEMAWQRLSKKSSTITIENYYEGDVFTVFIYAGKILGVYGIVPAFIIGDGESKIADLIVKLQALRKKNILYKDYPLANIDKDLNTSRVPMKGEIVKLKDSKKIQFGAVYINLTEEVKNSLEPLILQIEKLGINRSYLEIQCVSKNILNGTDDKSFRISRIEQNSSDLRRLFSAENNDNEFKYLLSFLFPEFDSKELTPTYIRPDEYYNTHYKHATSVDILKVAAYQLGLSIKQLDSRTFMIANKSKRILFEYGMSEYTTFGARELTCDKFLTKRILEKVNINTPVGSEFNINQMEFAWKAMGKHCLKKEGRLVVKPIDGRAGTGVSTDITNYDEFSKAWNLCKTLGSKKVIVEQQLIGDDYRIFVVQNKVCAVSQRVSAFVVGDGIHSIKDLIDIKNKERVKNRFLKTSLIKVTEQMLMFLRKRAISLDDIPDKDLLIRLSEVANASVGGEIIDRSDDIHPDWIPVAVKARKAIANSFHVGLDVMMEDISKSPNEQEWAIIEINTRPDLGVHLFPTEGCPRNIAKTYLESIFGKIEVVKKSYKITILGKVQGVGFRKWFKSICDYHSVVGYVSNNKSKDQLDAVVMGSNSALDEILMLCYRGPKSASVRSVFWNEIITDTEYKTLDIK